MSEPIFTVILNNEGEIFNLAGNVLKLVAAIRQRLIGIPPTAPDKDAAKVERAFSGYAANVFAKQQSTMSLLLCAIGDLEALANELPKETPERGDQAEPSGIVGRRG